MGPYKRNAWNIVNKSSTVGKQNNAFIQAVKDIFNAETANARRKAYRRHILKQQQVVITQSSNLLLNIYKNYQIYKYQI